LLTVIPPYPNFSDRAGEHDIDDAVTPIRDDTQLKVIVHI
jgi:hypothetical protein